MPAVRRRRTGLLSALAIVALVVPLAALAGPITRRPAAQERAVAALLDRIPLGFEANQGQYGADVRFAARAPGQQMLLTGSGLLVSPAGGGALVGVTLEGARPEPVIVGEQPRTARANRLVGDDPTGWRTDVPIYGAVAYRGAYPGVDAVFYGHGRQLEHDFVVAPGADPGVIRLAISGTTGSRIDGKGDLVLPTPAGELRLLAPHLYQDVNGARHPVAGGYQPLTDGRIGFRVGTYDRAKPLVIDPVLVSASYLGGTSTETAYGVAVDADGNIVIAGYTESSDFPTLNPAQVNLVQGESARTDVFVTKVKADGTSLLWSTYIGGKGRDAALAVAVGADGGVYVTGYSESADFPVVKALQSANAGGANDAFVAKLNSAGSALEYATYLGGKGADTGSGIAVDASGAATVVGHTGSADFPMVKPFQAALAKADDIDAFVAKVQPGGGALAYSSYLGGAGDDHGTDVALDGEGNAYVAGDTRAANFPTVRPLQAALAGNAAGSNFADAVVAKVKADGSGLVYSTYLGGSDSDKATAIAVDDQGNAYVSGNTGSPNFPVLSAFQSKKDGDFDAFVTKLKPDGNLAYSSFLGGSGSDGGEAVAVDRQGHAFVSGATASANFPTVRAFQGAKGGGFVDAFISEVNTGGGSLASSSYLGGRDDDQSAAVAVDRDGNVVVVGYTNSADFPLAKPFQGAKAGGVGDAFMAKVREERAGESSGGAPAASKRERRVRLLLTVTGGLLIAAILQTVWLRRRPEPEVRPQPAPTGRDVALPGLKYVPRRGRAVKPGDSWPAGSVPTKGADWDRREPVRVGERADGSEDDWGPVRTKRRPSAPAWDQAQRPVLRPMEREYEPEPAGAGVAATKMAAPDLWGSDAPLAEAAASVRAGGMAPDAMPDNDLQEDAGTGLSGPDYWPTQAGSGSPVDHDVDLDPLDVWGPLVVEQDPDSWADAWGVTDLLEPSAGGEARSPRGETAARQAAEWEAARAEEAALEAEWEAAEAAELAAAAERAAIEAAVEEAAARKVAELAEREAAELAAAEPVAAAEATGREPGSGREAGDPGEREVAQWAAPDARQAVEAAEREAAERTTAGAERAAAAAAGAERAGAGAERAAAERAAVEAAVRQAAEQEAIAMRAVADQREADRVAAERQAFAPEPRSREAPADLPASQRAEAEHAAAEAAELEAIAQARARVAQEAQAARIAAQTEAAEATQVAEAAKVEAQAAAQAAALQAALAAFEAAEAEAQRIAEADAARMAAQVAAQVAEAHAARIAAQAGAAAQAEAEARVRAELQAEAERQAAAAAQAAAQAQAQADARAAAAAAAAVEAEIRATTPVHSGDSAGAGRPAGSADALARADALAAEARAAQLRAAEAADAAELAELAELEAAEAAELAELEAAEARAAQAPGSHAGVGEGQSADWSAQLRAAEARAAEARAAEARAAETRAAQARTAELRAAEARSAQARAAEARAAESRVAESRVAEARAAEARAAEARAAEVRAAEARASEGRAAQARAAEAQAAEARAREAQAAEARAREAQAAEARAREARTVEARAREARAAEARAAEARANQARVAEARGGGGRVASVRPVGGPGGPEYPPPPSRPHGHELSLSELLDEDLPIPEPVGGVVGPETDQPWLDELLDEDFPIPDSPHPERLPVAPPPNRSGLVGPAGTPPGVEPADEEAEDLLPPPPPRLLTNLFEPDPDDPLVQSTRSRRGRRKDS